MTKRHMKRCSTLLITYRSTNQNYNKISPHTSQNSYYQKVNKKYMLERVWKEGNLPNMLVEM